MLKSIIFDFSRIQLNPVVVTQVRSKGHLNRPRLRNPYWFVKKNRTLHNDFVTPENKSFVQEVVHDKYGPPAIVKGVASYDQSANKLIKNAEFEIESQPFNPQIRRSGVIARKIGHYPLWLKNGEKIRTTLLQVVDNRVIKYIPPEQFKPMQKPKYTGNYGCLMVGAESTDPSLLTKEYCGLFRDSGVMPTKNLTRFIISPSAALPPGTPLNVNHFRVGDYVDVRGKTVDHGFQGVVKRHGFKGMPASHGVTKTHRRPGNIGGGGEKGRVWPGTKLPGHMGNRWRILKGVRILRMNTQYNVMWVTGWSVPGPTNGLVYIYDTILPLRRPLISPPVPTYLEKETPDSEIDIWHEDVHNFKHETITFQPE